MDNFHLVSIQFLSIPGGGSLPIRARPSSSVSFFQDKTQGLQSWSPLQDRYSKIPVETHWIDEHVQIFRNYRGYVFTT